MAYKSFLLAIVALIFSVNSNATVIISDISATTNSITFTINGDLAGYSSPNPAYLNEFSIRYSNSIFDTSLGTTSLDNAVTSSVFDSTPIDFAGYTGDFYSTGAYSWIQFTSNLTETTTATNRTVSLTTISGTNWLLDGTTGQIEFVWGNGSYGSGYTVLGLANITVGGPPVSTVPVPASVWLFGSGLLGLAGVAKRKKS